MLGSVGGRLFSQIGCAKCHVPALDGRNGEVTLYSDLLLHDMGPALDDKISRAMPPEPIGALRRSSALQLRSATCTTAAPKPCATRSWLTAAKARSCATASSTSAMPISGRSWTSWASYELHSEATGGVEAAPRCDAPAEPGRTASA